jgi:hypothetical protein
MKGKARIKSTNTSGLEEKKHQWKEIIKNINIIYKRINKNSCDQGEESKHL